MGKTVESPKKYIISCRVNDRELEALQEIAREYGTNISNLLRRSLDLIEQDSDLLSQAGA